jgi:glutathione S-transferase
MLELFHAAPSYYSMVARLALAEAGIPTISRLLDIHVAKQQLSPAYRQLNPHMTVPTLRGPDLLLTDSSQILAYAAEHARDPWADAEPAHQPGIAAVVAGHYAISIEDLTFSKLMSSKPWVKPVMVRMISGINRSLARDEQRYPDQLPMLQAKREQNRGRLAVFRDRAAPEVLSEQRAQVASYLAGLPTVVAGGLLFGSRISSADVVLAVLCSRLTMAGELTLLQRPDLQGWWQRMQQRPAFCQADLWTRFQRRRFVQALLAARHTPINP